MPLLKWLVRSGSSGYLYSWNTIPFRLRVCPWDVRKLRLNGNSQQCSENAFLNLAITYLLLLPKIAVNFVLYSGKCLERVIKLPLLRWETNAEKCYCPEKIMLKVIALDQTQQQTVAAWPSWLKEKEGCTLRRGREILYTHVFIIFIIYSTYILCIS